jgi:hypothetical protein
MSYGINLKNVSLNFDNTSDELVFYTAPRGGFSTSDNYCFTTIGFTTSEMAIFCNQFADIKANGNVSLSNATQTTSIDLNKNNGFYCAKNFTQPTVVKLCDVVAYETGLGATVYKSLSPTVGQKVLLNYSNPNKIFSVSTTINPYDNLIEHFSSRVLTNQFITDENFVYVKYSSTQNLFFLATSLSGNIGWQQIPSDKFYIKVDYYISQTDGDFTGTQINYFQFNRIVPQNGQTILINCSTLDDKLSGIYKIVSLSSVILIQQDRTITQNFPGQSFYAATNLDNSNNITKNNVAYYVPFSYGEPANCFTKNLQLKKFQNLNTGFSSFIPLPQDNIDRAKFKLSLTPTGAILTQNSDSFKLGVFVSNWCPDNGIICSEFSYEILENY